MRTDESPRHPSESLGGFAKNYFRSEWYAALLVVAVITIIHDKFGWLDAIDGYAFVGIGHLSSIRADGGASPEHVRAVVVLIDQTTFESRYLERSPLSRCQLLNDLGLIYNHKPKQPDLVAIDLDISPAKWIASEKDLPTVKYLRGKQSEVFCEKELYLLIKNNAHQIPTVLMTPFPAATCDQIARVSEWQKRMVEAGVRFGSAELPITYGLVIKEYDDPNTFADQARKLPAPTLQDENYLGDCISRGPAFDPRKSSRKLIDPRQYRRGIDPVLLSDPDSAEPFAERLNKALAKQAKSHAVFFGAGYGEGDVYLSPLGEVYGVEVHAAAYLGKIEEWAVLAFAIDVGIGLLFGLFIANCWHRYFAARFSEDATRRQSAPLSVLALVGGVILMALGLGWLSLLALRSWGIWLSPIPIAVGMLIDSFVSGSVEQAVHQWGHDRQALIDRLEDAVKRGNFVAVAENERRQRRPEPKSFCESARRFFWEDFVGLLKSSAKKRAAMLLLARTVIWVAVIVWAAIVLSFD